ncbi:hypothetical protein DES53_11577 [Roseimicrobium gellanilyticum]|uniref:Uncharacterized protein n=1 Tax=Roseimicrobium gellanilyticum TaxID=748857 RepID=A0A366H6P9_9BACT|nr:hypothetical protein [Roseimicrobium gellanilyticum]RBP36936.1 hypothetical protein DES53_11577 [Roseimicrobium gellanilyticum]
MPRRAKLITLGIFLVLLAIPVMHVARGWGLVEPLRFRHVPPAPDAVPLTRSLGTVAVEVIAENQTATPVDILAEWYLDSPPPDSSLHGLLMTSLVEQSMGVPGYWRVRVPAYGSARILLDLTPERRQQMGEGRGHVGYAFQSGPKATLTRASHWLAARLPKSWHRFLPKPSASRGAAPIDVPPHTGSK